MKRNTSESNTTRNKYVQLAADNNNYRSAIDRISTDTPISINTPDVVDILKCLYPTRHTLTSPYNDTIPRTFHTNICPIDYQIFIKTFSRIPKGKAAGHFGNITDVIRSMVTYVEHLNNKHTYANPIFKFFNLVTYTKIRYQ